MTSRPRLCMIVHAYYPIGETRVQREASALLAGGFEVEVVCLRGPGEAASEVVDRVRVWRLPVRRHRGAGMVSQALEYLAFILLAAVRVGTLHLRRRFDVIQVHNPPDALVWAAALPKATGARVVLDIHDLTPEFFAARTERSLDDPLVRLVTLQERLSCWLADRVVTVTDGWRRVLERRGIRPDKLGVVMNVADSSLFRSMPSESNGTEFRLLYHGTFTERYGVDLLVDAVARVREEIDLLHLDLVGDGEQREELVQQIRRHGLEDVVHVSNGFLSAEHLPALIARADVGVVPNRSNVFTDGILPTKLMEYVAMGTPVVVARTPGVEEYFDDSMVAFFSPGDPEALARRLVELWREPDVRMSLAEAAAAFNLLHGWDRVASDYVALVRDTIVARPA